MNLKVSIIVATDDRASLLDRSLATYANQTLARRYWEYVLVDDSAADAVSLVAAKWAAAGLPIRVLSASEDLICPKSPGSWRDGSSLRNAGSTHCFGEVLISTHPEIMIPPDALEIAYEAVKERPGSWHTAIPYWLPNADYDALPWQEDLSVLEHLAGFFRSDSMRDGRAPIQDNRLQGRHRDWDEDTWFGIDMGFWRRIGGLREFSDWAYANVDFANRRRAMGIETNMLTSETSRALSGSLMVYHQWHPSPRDSPGALDRIRLTAPAYADGSAALAAGALHGLYWSGHRERENDDRAVLGDHVDRYHFAASVCQGRAVLDVPCGTGYGSTLIGEPFRYVGLDIDAESIQWARGRFRRPGCEFYQGNMAHMAFPDESFDTILCFEGLEHLEDHHSFMTEVSRLLRPGGWLVVSTPHKGVATGTRFDRFMLQADELEARFCDIGLQDLSWFCQRHYGGTPGMNPVEPGLLPEASIVILVARKPGCNEAHPERGAVYQVGERQ